MYGVENRRIETQLAANKDSVYGNPGLLLCNEENAEPIPLQMRQPA